MMLLVKLLETNLRFLEVVETQKTAYLEIKKQPDDDDQHSKKDTFFKGGTIHLRHQASQPIPLPSKCSFQGKIS